MARKGQSATEYLMTYGWAILAIIIIGAVLWNMGMFGGQCGKASKGFIGANVMITDWSANSAGVVNATIKNAAGAAITVTKSAGTGTQEIASGATAAVTELDTIAAGTAGNCYTDESLTVTYAVSGGTSHQLTGKISGAYEG